MTWESFEQVQLMMRMYPNDSHNRQRIAEILAGELPTILQQYGERKAQIVEEWLKGQGFGVLEKEAEEQKAEGWLEVARLVWLLLRRVQWQDINPKEVFRVVVWLVMGHKP